MDRSSAACICIGGPVIAAGPKVLTWECSRCGKRRRVRREQVGVIHVPRPDRTSSAAQGRESSVSGRLEQLLDEGQVEAALLLGDIVPPLTEREIELVRQAFDHGYRVGKRKGAKT